MKVRLKKWLRFAPQFAPFIYFHTQFIHTQTHFTQHVHTRAFQKLKIITALLRDFDHKLALVPAPHLLLKRCLNPRLVELERVAVDCRLELPPLNEGGQEVQVPVVRVGEENVVAGGGEVGLELAPHEPTDHLAHGDAVSNNGHVCPSGLEDLPPHEPVVYASDGIEHEVVVLEGVPRVRGLVVDDGVGAQGFAESLIRARGGDRGGAEGLGDLDREAKTSEREGANKAGV